VQQGFPSLIESQRQRLDEFWNESDVRITGEPFVQQALRFNLFQIFQATVRLEGAGLPAKGLTGMGYEGHYFWDTEVYVLPFLIYTAPRIARNLLKFRHGMLGKARQRAAEVNQRGALFPWRTINGEEASAYYAAGTAQYHINADIMYALKKYVEVTGDEEFLRDEGAEMLVETARLWLDLGFFSENKKGSFCISGVTGPDEYNTVVNNNAFTNLMARENLWYAAATVRRLHGEHPARFAILADRTGVELAETDDWQRAADRMYVPFDEQRRIHLQDDDFLERKPWDFENTPADRYPLLLHYHPLVLYRHNVIKQADVILAMFLLGHEVPAGQKKRNFDFYDPLTTGDSSLSACIQSIMAIEIGYREKARDYARYAILMDLADVAGNAADGCHIASMGGTWMVAAYGAAGLRDYGGRISFNPRPPKRFDTVRFPLRIRGRKLVVDISREAATYVLEEGEDLTIYHGEQELRLSRGEPVSMGLEPETTP
jgi:alpha,alpha-trehalose phosphorylase